MGALFDLGPEDLERLVHEYGIGDDDAKQPNRDGASQGKKPVTRTVESHERNLNYFMAHIGVRAYRIIPPTLKMFTPLIYNPGASHCDRGSARRQSQGKTPGTYR